MSTATEFHKFKDVLFNVKIIRHKLKEFNVKSINQELMKLTKIVSQAVKRLKKNYFFKIVITEKNYND